MQFTKEEIFQWQLNSPIKDESCKVNILEDTRRVLEPKRKEAEVLEGTNGGGTGSG